MASLDAAALSAVLKTKYTQKKFNLLCYKKNPLYAMMAKMTDFGGDVKVVALRNGTPQGRGVTIAQAQAAQTPSLYNRFLVTRKNDYATAKLTGEAIDIAKGEENALITALSKEIDGAIHTCMRSLAISMYRNGGGARGQILSGVGTPTVTLVNKSEITNFERGMQIQASDDDGTGGAGLRSAGAFVTIIGINRDAGTLTISGDWDAGIAAIQDGDYLFQGNASGTDYANMLSGLAAWLPWDAPTSGDSFFGLDRSVDVTRLSGLRWDGEGGPIESTLIDAAHRLDAEGGQPDTVFMNNRDRASLIQAVGSKVIYDRAVSIDEPDIGFKTVALEGPSGPINLVADINCPQGDFYMLQTDTWHLETIGPAPKMLDLDGLSIMRSSNADDYEARIGYRGNMTCEAPGWNLHGRF